MDLSKYKILFISESREHLEDMTRNLLDLEKNPTDKISMDEIFRHAHSIKGMASSMGYNAIEVMSHTLEDAMDVFRKGLAAITPEAIDEMLTGRDVIDEMIDEVERTEEPVFEKGKEFIERLRNWCKLHSPAFSDKFKSILLTESAPTKAFAGEDYDGFNGEVVSPNEVGRSEPAWERRRENGNDEPAAGDWYIVLRFEGETEAPAARAFLALKRIQSLGEVKSTPTNDEIRAGKFAGNLKIELKGTTDISRIRELLDSLTGVKQYQIEPLGLFPVSASPQSAPESREASAITELPRTIRVETRTLDRFVNMVGELLTVRSSLRELAKSLENTDLDRNLDRLDGLIHELHSQVMDVRMMPLEIVTSRFPRAVRDLARAAGKEADLMISGEDIELDRAILERLNDPFLHMLRNAVDHGVEAPEERERLRKPRKGRITIRAQREKDMIVIEVADDGKGIDIDVIKETAIAKNIITPEAAETLSVEDTLMTICLPGFSTSETVSFISGRGVGMDVVKTTIESLGGGLRISTKLGEGTRITLHLPRTVSILNVLLVKVEPEIFAVPIGKLLRTVEISSSAIKETQKGRMLVLDSELIPLFDLREMLGMNSATSKETVFALIVDHGLRPFGVAVDGFLGQEEAFIRPLGRPLSRIEGLAGVMTRGDGRPVFVLDMPNLRGGSTQT